MIAVQNCKVCHSLLVSIIFNLPVFYKGHLKIFSLEGKYCLTCKIPLFKSKQIDSIQKRIDAFYDELDGKKGIEIKEDKNA